MIKQKKKELIKKGNFLSFFIEKIFYEDGSLKTREFVKFPDSVGVLPVTENGVVLVRQYRSGAGEYLWEAPAGLIEKNETPAKCAIRELKEETGFSAEIIYPVGSFFLSPGVLSEKIYLFLAYNLKEGKANPEEDEMLEIKNFTWDEVENMLDDGIIKDIKTAFLIFYAITFGKRWEVEGKEFK